MQTSLRRLELIEAARGIRPLDLVIRNVQLVNVLTCEIYPADIGIYQDRIAIVGPAGKYELEAAEVIDGTGKWATPGFVDTHLHVESTMVTPPNFAAAVLPFGTTTVITDPHEIGNVLGMDGMRYMVESSAGLPIRFYNVIPSCVPAVLGKETAGAEFGPAEVAEMLTWDRILGVAEVMDYIGTVNGDPRMLGIVQAGMDAGRTIQGHSPLLMGRDLNAYIAAGIQNDHELRAGDESLEKLRLGLLPLLKVSSFGNHMPNIMPTLKEAHYIDVALCTDDIEPADLLENGHMDRVIREMIRWDIEPARAIRWATYVGANHYQLRDYGAIVPGYFADIVLLSSLKDVKTSEVLVGGKLVVQDGKLINPIVTPSTNIRVEDTVHVQPLDASMFELHAPIEEGTVNVNIIALAYNRLSHLETAPAQIKDGKVMLESVGEGVCYLSVVPRHGQQHPPTLGLLKGLGLQEGTLAGTIAHDSHNIIMAGYQPSDMLLAVETLREMGGGLVLVKDGQVVATVELPIAGLMSPKPVPELAEEVKRFSKVAVEMGIEARSPSLAISGLALTVIPEVRISDLGAILDVQTQAFIPVFV